MAIHSALQVGRRHFLKSSSTARTALLGAPAFLRGAALNEKLNLAIIGAGGRGAANTQSVSSENIVALCDVSEANLNKAAQKYPQARKDEDFRKIFEQANDIDAVVVSTAEHTHAFATLPALQLGLLRTPAPAPQISAWLPRRLRLRKIFGHAQSSCAAASTRLFG